MKKTILTQLRALTRSDFKDLEKTTAPVSNSPTKKVKISLLVPAREFGEELKKTLSHATAFFVDNLKRDPEASFEIILIPNPAPGLQASELATILFRARELAKSFSSVQVVPHFSPPETPGKGSALRTGFQASSGEVICFTDSDLPYELSFFTQALSLYAQGYDLVTGNRRQSLSRFDIPVSVLPFAYSRHRLGLFFNGVVRRLLPIKTTDTQAGIKLFSRRLAERAFALQRCPGFFFDLELLLACQGMGLSQAEVPVSLHLNSEKSTVRIIRESILALYWLSRITTGYFLGHYGKRSRKVRVLGRFSHVSSLSPATRVFLSLRWALTPYSKMSRHLPPRGQIFDLGCGHGLFGLALAQQSSERTVTGIDHDEARIQAATQAASGLANLNFRTGSIFESVGRAQGISLIDVMHYFDTETQKENIQKAFSSLTQNGVLIFREVDPRAGVISVLNRLYERFATSIGFTRSQEERLYFRSREDWLDLLRQAGFRARAERCSSILFADVLFIGEKLGEKPGAIR